MRKGALDWKGGGILSKSRNMLLECESTQTKFFFISTHFISLTEKRY